MKKALIFVMVAILSFNMIGCGKKEKTSEAATTEAVEEGEAVAETDGTSSGNDAMDAYIKLSQSSFDAMAESYKGVMEFKASGEGSTLKYEMRLLTDAGDDKVMKEQTDTQMEMQKEQMEAVVESLKAAGIEDPNFIVEYQNKNGDVIASYEFK